MILKDKTVGVISLGCDKNRIDTEKMLALLDFGKITQDLSEANIVIINSCAFLESSRKEAIDTVFECNSYRGSGKLEKIVLTGCLPEKFIDDLFDELTEVDLFIGIKDYPRLVEGLERTYRGERVNYVKTVDNFKTEKRVVTTPEHYAYLRIADGCDNKCTYCLIPSIRGKYRSEKIEDLISEAESLGETEELILVAQDITRYGIDIYGEVKLIELLRRLSALDGIKSIRLLYAYPDMLSDDLIDEIANNPKIIKYLDIPLQHADDSVLKRMNRKGTGESYSALIKKLREKVDGIAIRSTFIAGFPGESEENFKNLLTFIQKEKLFNAGFFAYSREEGTPAYRLPGQIDEEVKIKRVEALYEAQRKISAERNKSFIGKTLEALTDGVDYDKQSFYGRAYFSAPDIDGVIYFTSEGEIRQGERYTVRITSADDYDLYGETL
ncbi:MAG: 30S ribosomal protein S12 methylthiotransferase RimO [Clostridia bacterium]|nr:30S ribosomal protein S12 methylthiotransferase RimO [Clostridia bacterium]